MGAHRDKFEAALAADPDNMDAFLVYGDWLQSVGDPRGELIALQAALRDRPDDPLLRAEEYRIIHACRDSLLGDLQDKLGVLHLTWHLGFIRSARLLGGGGLDGCYIDDVLAQLVEHPSGRFLRSLTLGNLHRRDFRADHRNDLGAWFEGVKFPSTLNRFFLFDDPGAPAFDRWSDLVRSVPNLEHLNLYGEGFSLQGTLPKSLRSLRIWTAGCVEDNLRTVGDADLPVLEEIELWWDHEDDLTESDVLRGVLYQHQRSLQRIRAHIPENRLSSRAKMMSEALEIATFNEGVPYFSYEDDSWLRRMVERMVNDPTIGETLCECAGAGVVLYNTGSTMLADGRFRDAIPLLRLSLELGNRLFYRQAWANTGIAHANIGDFQGAVEISRRGILSFPDDNNLYAILIDALRHLRRLEDALHEVEYAKSLIDESNEGQALCQDCIVTYLVAGKWKAALRTWDDFSAAFGAESARDRLFAAAVIAHAHAGYVGECERMAAELTESNDPIVHHVNACVHALSGRLSLARAEVEKARDAQYPEMAWIDREDPLTSRL